MTRTAMGKPEWPHDLTADTWVQCDNLWLYADYFADEDECPRQPSERKLRLLVVAAVRAVWEHVCDPAGRAAVEAAEQYADAPGDTSLEDVSDRAEEVWARFHRQHRDDRWCELACSASHAAWRVASRHPFNDATSGPPYWIDVLYHLDTDHSPTRTEAEATALHLALFHDIIRNPFRPPLVIDPRWLTSAVVGLARRMYESRDFAAMPILADALEDAGCADAELLGHCRSAGPHVRGCWAVDLLLGHE